MVSQHGIYPVPYANRPSSFEMIGDFDGCTEYERKAEVPYTEGTPVVEERNRPGD